jgi:hypothetical protein
MPRGLGGLPHVAALQGLESFYLATARLFLTGTRESEVDEGWMWRPRSRLSEAEMRLRLGLELEALDGI